MAAMAEMDRRPDGGYSPDMDGPTHESTYGGFVSFTAIGALVVACCVVALGIGGIKSAWITAIFGVVFATVAGTIGALVPSVGWRLPSVVLAILLVILIIP